MQDEESIAHSGRLPGEGILKCVYCEKEFDPFKTNDIEYIENGEEMPVGWVCAKCKEQEEYEEICKEIDYGRCV